MSVMQEGGCSPRRVKTPAPDDPSVYSLLISTAQCVSKQTRVCVFDSDSGHEREMERVLSGQEVERGD